MIYILLDNYDEGLELSEVETFDELAEYLRKLKEVEGHLDRIEHIIFGEEVLLGMVKEYYHL